jgi:4'-phosphopantetheinyl transferase
MILLCLGLIGRMVGNLNGDVIREVEVYAVKVDKNLDVAVFEALLDYVATEKSARIKRFFKYEDALRTLLGDILARYLICQKLNLKNQQLQFGKNQYGKPFLVNGRSVCFNISHSGEWVVCALSSLPVGIDVEKMGPVDDALGERIFTHDEYRVLRAKSSSEQRSCFYKLWTLKESFIKAIGKGLSIPLTSFSISFDQGERISVKTESGTGDWFFKQYDWGEEYQLAVCAYVNVFVDTVKIINLAECISGLTMVATVTAQG